MAVLPRFLGKFKAKPKTIEEPLAELDLMSMDALFAIAVENESDVLRLAAIARLDYGPVLISWLMTTLMPMCNRRPGSGWPNCLIKALSRCNSLRLMVFIPWRNSRAGVLSAGRLIGAVIKFKQRPEVFQSNRIGRGVD